MPIKLYTFYALKARPIAISIFIHILSTKLTIVLWK